MDEISKFQNEVSKNIESLGTDTDLQALSRVWIREITKHKWAYNFSWLGRPAIQFPNDTWQMQELIWQCKPDLVIETGIAHGGSLIFSASMLAMLDICDAIEKGETFNPKKSNRKVIGLDIDIREHNRAEITSHPMASRIEMYEGSSIDPSIVEAVQEETKKYKKVLVCLDSNHTHEHVLQELACYANLVSVGSYLVVFDTIIEDMPNDMFPDRPWGIGNNPKTAVHTFLKNNNNFVIDKKIQHKLLITVAPDGFLKRVR